MMMLALTRIPLSRIRAYAVASMYVSGDEISVAQPWKSIPRVLILTRGLVPSHGEPPWNPDGNDRIPMDEI